MVEAGEWHDTKDVLIQTARLSDSRSFEGKDGKRYKWKSPWGYLVVRSFILVVWRPLKIFQ